MFSVFIMVLSVVYDILVGVWLVILVVGVFMVLGISVMLMFL